MIAHVLSSSVGGQESKTYRIRLRKPFFYSADLMNTILAKNLWVRTSKVFGDFGRTSAARPCKDSNDEVRFNLLWP